LHPDLLAYHVVVAGTPAAGPASIVFLDVARVSRAKGRVRPSDAAPGLAALALSLRPIVPLRFRLAVLRAYLGGSLSESRVWRGGSREAAAIDVLARLGVPVPRLAFAGRDRRHGHVAGTIDLAPARPLDELLREGALSRDATGAALRALAQAVATLHDARLHH